ncbi:radical SAM protein [Nanoarchaeota archaeon]
MSWYCDVGTCDFCFRSTTKHKIKHAQNAKRSLPSIMADAIIGKHLGWHIEFLTGGYRIFPFEEIVDIAKKVSEIYGHKIWVNLGALSDEQLDQIEPYVEGVCASIETVESSLHNRICPDKPIEPYEDMLARAKKKGFKTSMTIVIGLGEKKDDLKLLHDFIERHSVDQITFYALKPVQGTPYIQSPAIDYYAWWIYQTRIKFPKLKIMAGLTPKNVDYTFNILKAGANGITKFPAVAQFNSEKANKIESMAKEAGRKFEGSLTVLPDIDWDKIVDSLPFTLELKSSIKEKLSLSLRKMKSIKS